MKITWILPSKIVSGGNRVIFEYGNRLAEKGHEVVHIIPFEQFLYPYSFFKKLEYQVREKFYYKLKFKTNKPFESKIDWFETKARIIEVPDLFAKYIPNADVVIATSWETAEWVNTYPITKGTKFYFIQSYETWAGPKNRVEQTYKLPLKKITIASWIKEKIEKDLKERVYGVIINGVNFDQFYNDNKIYHLPRRVGMLYHDAEWKGVKDGLAAFQIARKSYPDLQLVMYGTKKTKKNILPKDIEFYENPPQNKLKDIYSSLDIFLSPSWIEGCQLPPMEAMACKCAVVATNVGGIPDYTIPGKTALVSPPKDPKSLAKNLIALLENEKLLKDISLAGYNYIKQFTWDKATDELEKILIHER